MQPVFIGKTSVTLAPGQSETLSFIYGVQQGTQALPLNPNVTPIKLPKLNLSKTSCSLGSDKCDALKREFNWKVLQLQGWSLYRSYYHKYVVPQGSVYLYEQPKWLQVG